MTKRYTVNQSQLRGYFVYDEETDFQFPAIDEMEADIFCEKLNEQDQRIKELKQENKKMDEQLSSIFNLIDDEMELCKKQYEDASPEKEKILRETYSIANAIKEIMTLNKKY